MGASKVGKVLFTILVAVMIVSVGVLSYYYLGGGQEAFSGTDDNANAVPSTTLNLAPDFNYPVVGGGSVSLSALRGKVVVLDFMATWCGPCETQIGNLNQIYAEYAAKGVIFISLDIDYKETAAQLLDFKNRLGAKWQFALDENGLGMNPLYDAASIPTMVFVNRDGYIAHRDGGVTSTWELTAAIAPLL